MLGIRGESAKSLVFWGPKKIESKELKFPVRRQVLAGLCLKFGICLRFRLKARQKKWIFTTVLCINRLKERKNGRLRNYQKKLTLWHGPCGSSVPNG
jgi:hypothetical protein